MRGDGRACERACHYGCGCVDVMPDVAGCSTRSVVHLSISFRTSAVILGFPGLDFCDLLDLSRLLDRDTVSSPYTLGLYLLARWYLTRRSPSFLFHSMVLVVTWISKLRVALPADFESVDIHNTSSS